MVIGYKNMYIMSNTYTLEKKRKCSYNSQCYGNITLLIVN